MPAPGCDKKIVKAKIVTQMQNFIVIAGIVIITIGEAEFTQETMTEMGAFTIAWLSSSLAIVAIPIWSLINWLSNNYYFTSYTEALEHDGLTWTQVNKCAIFVAFAQTWSVYCYMAALHYTTATAMITLYNTSGVFIWIGSLIFLGDKLDFWKFLAVLLSLGGSVYVAYGTSNSDDSEPFLAGEPWQGNLLALASAVLASFDLIYVKKVMKDECGLTSCNIILAQTGFFSLVLLWPFILIFHYTGVERVVVPDSLEVWGLLWGSVLFAFLMNWLFTIGIAFTNPLYVTIACVLSMPGAALFDYLVRGVDFTIIEGVGCFLVIVGFLLINYDVHKWMLKNVFHLPVEGQDDSLPLQDPNAALRSSHSHHNFENRDSKEDFDRESVYFPSEQHQYLLSETPTIN